MREYESPADGPGGEADAADDAENDRIVVAVVRTGGIAGVRRRWRAAPAPEQTPAWLTLVQRCPWDEPVDADPQSRDRYIWSIHAQIHQEQLEQVVPESRLEGAWRELVDAVRDADTSTES